MNYRSVSDLNADTNRFARDHAIDADLIVGIPRSGLLVANLLCLYHDIPMTDVDGLCEGELLDTGNRYDEDHSIDDVDSVLVVDDSVKSGSQMTETRNRLEEQDFPFDISYGAIYISPWGHEFVDYWTEVVSTPRVFEWNLMHHPVLQYSCVEIDGVLCRGPTPEENDDGERYREFLAEVEPTIVPNQEIGHLVTSRPETYRAETERWLDEHGVRYDTLVMTDQPGNEAGEGGQDHAQYKADVYASTDAPLFIESDPGQAAEISRRTGKPVFCYETVEMIQPGHAKRTYRLVERAVSKFKEEPAAFPALAWKYLYYRGYHYASKVLP